MTRKLKVPDILNFRKCHIYLFALILNFKLREISAIEVKKLILFHWLIKLLTSILWILNWQWVQWHVIDNSPYPISIWPVSKKISGLFREIKDFIHIVLKKTKTKSTLFEDHTMTYLQIKTETYFPTWTEELNDPVSLLPVSNTYKPACRSMHMCVYTQTHTHTMGTIKLKTWLYIA